MYNTSYEEYMRTVLGYIPNYAQDTFANNDYYIMPDNFRVNNDKLNDLYPDIYKKVYPLVCEECVKNSMPVTVEILEQMTDNIIKKIEIDLKIETRKEDVRNSKYQETNSKQENRAIRNNTLRDLIKILILKELISGGNQGRPSFPPRPPMPGLHPPFPGGRPPFPRGPENVMTKEF